MEQFDRVLDQVKNKMDRVELLLIDVLSTIKGSPREQAATNLNSQITKSSLAEIVSPPVVRDDECEVIAGLYSNTPEENTTHPINPETDSFTMSYGEQFAKEIRPQVYPLNNVTHDVCTCIENKVTLLPKYFLDKADPPMPPKIVEFQPALKDPPVSHWYQSQPRWLDLKEEFPGTCVEGQRNSLTTWLIILETIAKATERMNVLHNPRAIYSRLTTKEMDNNNFFALWTVTQSSLKLYHLKL
ncbi:BgTH12-01753 [Blumeria graminis f. sp. triticale]|uniref:BgtAc-30181 n=3 Tax=Blumeria graminis TaxID=34373 RepID=A0A9X9QBT4_BLUGR|nr:hypothetical protein BGT96224_Ac30181 [Blumeria graminis f. sp. tritici 96224]CAD6501501.1 BgTH12-01753 [Blumeria graminis f. sp. triticale]VDB84044.1 BgtAc-30181 [Blumeria graminis f. sp. tritici]